VGINFQKLRVDVRSYAIIGIIRYHHHNDYYPNFSDTVIVMKTRVVLTMMVMVMGWGISKMSDLVEEARVHKPWWQKL
jgi:hypothetical protein